MSQELETVCQVMAFCKLKVESIAKVQGLIYLIHNKDIMMISPHSSKGYWK